MGSTNDSKALWLELEEEIRPESMSMGRYTTQAYIEDPCAIAFIAARYKFCSKMLAGRRIVLEVGCGDGFGSALVAQKSDKVICTDINKELLIQNSERMKTFKNIEYLYHDFREKPFGQSVEGAYLIDVVEHIYPEEEKYFLGNIVDSIEEHGVCLIGTPNKTSEQYASKYSRDGHVNLKDHQSLGKIGERYFFNSFIFGMNDEVVHTGFPQMSHFLWLLGVNPRKF